MSGILWIGLVVGLWALLPRLLLRRAALRRLDRAAWGGPLLAGWSLLGVILAAPGLQRGVTAGYPGDSFFTLDAGARAGLAALTAGLALLALWAAFRLAKRLSGRRPRPGARALGLAGNLGVTLGAFTLCYVLSPQVYYSYYRIVLPGLPAQWVVQAGDQLARLAAALALQAGDSLAAQAAGTLFWVLAGLTVSVHAVSWGAAEG